MRIRPPSAGPLPQWDPSISIHATSATSIAIAAPEASQGCVIVRAQTICRAQALESEKYEEFLLHTDQAWDCERRYKNGDRGQTYNFTHVCGQETTQDEYFQLTTANMVSSSEWQWLPALAAACDSGH